jgi:hypothetical protein
MDWRNTNGKPHQPGDPGDDPVRDLAGLLSSQRLAVLITSGREGPHGSLVAFAVSVDLRELVFATRRTTLKFENLREQPRVALLIDNRGNDESDFHRAAAATAYGPAREADGEDRHRLEAQYLTRHPCLGDFVASHSCALVQVKVEQYRLVRRFQDVTVLVPES